MFKSGNEKCLNEMRNSIVCLWYALPLLPPCMLGFRNGNDWSAIADWLLKDVASTVKTERCSELAERKSNLETVEAQSDHR